MAISQNQIDSIHGANVVGQGGAKVGSVGQVYVDDRTGDPTWVTVKTGLLGSTETFVPLTNVSLYEDTLTVPYSKSFIKDAPSLGADGDIGTVEHELYRYYQVGGEYGTGTMGSGTDKTRLHADQTGGDTTDGETGHLRLRRHEGT